MASNPKLEESLNFSKLQLQFMEQGVAHCVDLNPPNPSADLRLTSKTLQDGAPQL